MRKQLPGGKTRITIRLDDDVLQWFRGQVRSSGGSYQGLINLALLSALNRPNEFKVHVKGALTNGCSKEEIRDAS